MNKRIKNKEVKTMNKKEKTKLKNLVEEYHNSYDDIESDGINELIAISQYIRKFHK